MASDDAVREISRPIRAGEVGRGNAAHNSYAARIWRLLNTPVAVEDLQAACYDYDEGLYDIQSVAINTLIDHADSVEELRYALYWIMGYADQLRGMRTEVFDDGYNARKPHAPIKLPLNASQRPKPDMVESDTVPGLFFPKNGG